MSLDERLKLAGQAAIFAGSYAQAAHLATDREEKRRLATQAFHSWAYAARQWSALEALAPNCAREGYAEAAKIQDFIEGRAA